MSVQMPPSDAMVPSSWLLTKMIKRAEGKFEADRE